MVSEMKKNFFNEGEMKGCENMIDKEILIDQKIFRKEIEDEIDI